MKSIVGSIIYGALFIGAIAFGFSAPGRALIAHVESLSRWAQIGWAVFVGMGGMVLGLIMMLRDKRRNAAKAAAQDADKA